MKRLLSTLLLCAVTSVQADVAYKGDFEQATGVGPIFGPTTSPADYIDTTRGSIDYPFIRIVSNPKRQGNRAARTYLCDSTGATGACPYSSRELTRNPPVEKRSLDIRTEVPSIFTYNETQWVALSLLFPTANQFVAGDNGVYQGMVFQIMTDIDGLYIPSFAVYSRVSDFRYAAAGKASGFGTHTLGVWHDFLIGFRPHCTDGAGLTVLKYRQTPVGGTGGAWTTVLNSTTRSVTIDICGKNRPNEIDYSWGTLLYRAGTVDGDASMYFDGPWVADTEAEAAAFFTTAGGRTTLATPTGATISW